ncbi:hypothetical protein HS088_TW15G01155 [Tripterygium wilfordii]|uniref:Uncharacterized protein n=1 Tax=Tripterygium wilfordii TaxID=458696 RepID=A0A7J7CNJ9_TRIWF|nr:hypothetical protein HS088_TW15G01155 [Tripterygium wilfordii]
MALLATTALCIVELTDPTCVPAVTPEFTQSIKSLLAKNECWCARPVSEHQLYFSARRTPPCSAPPATQMSTPPTPSHADTIVSQSQAAPTRNQGRLGQNF